MRSKLKESQLNQFKEFGFVVVKKAIPIQLVNRLERELLRLMNEKIKRMDIVSVPTLTTQRDHYFLDFKPHGGNHDVNRWNMHLPSTPLFLQRKIVANIKVMRLVQQIIGREAVCVILASDTPVAGASNQNIHQDGSNLGICVNIPLIDFNLENGPIEVWPRSHREWSSDGPQCFSNRPVAHDAKELRQICRKVKGQKLLLEKGDILIRDVRMAHRGTRSVSSHSRPCLTLWYKSSKGVADFCPPPMAAEAFAAIAKAVREQVINLPHSNKKLRLHSVGNYLGRAAEEAALSDRNQFRPVPKALWSRLHPEVKHLLRYSNRPQKIEEIRNIKLLADFFVQVLLKGE